MSDEIKRFSKECPTCKKLMYYGSNHALKYSTAHSVLCQECKINDQNKRKQRSCSQCHKIIVYKSVRACGTANKRKSLCKSCGTSNAFNEPEIREARSKRVIGDKNPMFGKLGNQNHFYGRHHTEEIKRKMSEERSGIPLSDEHKNKIKKYYETHQGTMKGKTVYSIWLAKFGKEIADLKQKEFTQKQILLAKRGKDNPMYGKPSPNGSGNGWKGWYKNIFFRSLRELSYLIYLHQNNIVWQKAETKEYSIEYTDYKGGSRTYRPDFLINNKILVEIKPKRLHNTPTVLLKSNAAIEFCRVNGLEYQIIDVEINSNEIGIAYEAKDIIFLPKYEQKYLDFITGIKL